MLMRGSVHAPGAGALGSPSQSLAPQCNGATAVVGVVTSSPGVLSSIGRLRSLSHFHLRFFVPSYSAGSIPPAGLLPWYFHQQQQPHFPNFQLQQQQQQFDDASYASQGYARPLGGAQFQNHLFGIPSPPPSAAASSWFPLTDLPGGHYPDDAATAAFMQHLLAAPPPPPPLPTSAAAAFAANSAMGAAANLSQSCAAAAAAVAAALANPENLDALLAITALLQQQHSQAAAAAAAATAAGPHQHIPIVSEGRTDLPPTTGHLPTGLGVPGPDGSCAAHIPPGAGVRAYNEWGGWGGGFSHRNAAPRMFDSNPSERDRIQHVHQLLQQQLQGADQPLGVVPPHWGDGGPVAGAVGGAVGAGVVGHEHLWGRENASDGAVPPWRPAAPGDPTKCETTTTTTTGAGRCPVNCTTTGTAPDPLVDRYRHVDAHGDMIDDGQGDCDETESDEWVEYYRRVAAGVGDPSSRGSSVESGALVAVGHQVRPGAGVKQDHHGGLGEGRLHPIFPGSTPHLHLPAAACSPTGRAPLLPLPARSAGPLTATQ
eukprot:GHVU01223467.1.p1 GENE.GHVU01223467.1~~GHVU01223467.1.p1  ORF type:complete len:542 (+),score=77.95 GHVU01223467.1:856-2481(+)